MIVMKNFEVYENKLIAGASVLFLKDEADRDWYESQKLFNDKTLKFVFNSAGVIISMNYDASMLWPVGNSVAEISASKVPAGLDINGEWVFDGKRITSRIYTAEEWQAKAESQRQSLLTAANATTTLWEREKDAGILDDDDKASLTEWIKYAKALRKLDLSSISDEMEYKAITWPHEPI